MGCLRKLAKTLRMVTILRSRWFRRSLLALIFLFVAFVLYVLIGSRGVRGRIGRIGDFMENPIAYPEWQIIGGERCGDAPMLMPTTGFIGVRWNDGLAPISNIQDSIFLALMGMIM